jgi:hypothetical protein
MLKRTARLSLGAISMVAIASAAYAQGKLTLDSEYVDGDQSLPKNSSSSIRVSQRAYVPVAVSQSEPTREQISSYLINRLPNYLEISSFEFKNFPGGAGSGRTSVSGAARLKVDLFSESPEYVKLKAKLVNIGFSSNDVDYFLPQVVGDRFDRRYREFLAVHSAGSKKTFMAELNYTELVNGFRFSGGVNIEGVDGTPASSLPPNAYLAGTPKFDEVVARLGQLRTNTVARRGEAMDRTVNLLSASKLTAWLPSGQNTGKFDKQYQIDCPAGGQWFSRREYEDLKFSIQCQAHFLRNSGIGNARFKAGDRTTVLIEARIEYQKRFWLGFSIFSPDPMRQSSGFQGTGEVFEWSNDDQFRWGQWVFTRDKI